MGTVLSLLLGSMEIICSLFLKNALLITVKFFKIILLYFFKLIGLKRCILNFHT